MMFAIVGHRLAWSAVGFSRRFRTAWDNGWITFRPVLIGQVCLERTVSHRDSDDHYSTVTYYYSAPVQILNPDGSMTEAVTEEFILGRKPSALRKRGFAVADDIESAIVDFSHNNGWAVAGLNLHDTSPAPELHNQLHGQQEEAVLMLAESSWVPQTTKNTDTST